MKPLHDYSNLRIDHPLWSIVRYYRSLGRSSKIQKALFESIVERNAMSIGEAEIGLPPEIGDLLAGYVEQSEDQLRNCMMLLRTEDDALKFCDTLGIEAGVTRTQSTDHAQSSKSLDSAISHIAQTVALRNGLCANVNPQDRVVMSIGSHLHISARRVDGAIPGLFNPKVIWENKEYWGGGKGKAGGSKMSDAVYECHLVGMEIREYESKARCKVVHIVCVDGRDQWEARKSDLRRLVDLLNQGYIDTLIVGREVESTFEGVIEAAII
ncbi:hypothetical protein KBY85_14780 [Cyanobium sp. BA5m-10]|uniref:DUF7687 domain-containing protein n=1 Tax=Cyanobium sp. BA5m-10 TaxID=2823705 RepID=UPI0020CC1B2F|nr:hypothetical protein [Cyanobium sp. BA5m-10]MCP9905389.1 hypothetical protein [Cyanobium sp. BA5m-10]